MGRNLANGLLLVTVLLMVSLIGYSFYSLLLQNALISMASSILAYVLFVFADTLAKAIEL